jgi:hypothetical protein
MDVLVFTPVKRLQTETIEALFALQYDGPLTFILQRDNPHGVGLADHLHQYQRGRDLFLRGDYDAMLVIEDDIIPPVDTLIRLVALDCDVAYGCYQFRSDVVNVLEKYHGHKPARNMGESLSIRGLWISAKEKGIVECSGAGLGIVLIRRPVLDAIPFELSGGGHADWNWTEKVYRAGYSMRADTAVQAGHKISEDVTLWPS